MWRFGLHHTSSPWDDFPCVLSNLLLLAPLSCPLPPPMPPSLHFSPTVWQPHLSLPPGTLVTPLLSLPLVAQPLLPYVVIFEPPPSCLGPGTCSTQTSRFRIESSRLGVWTAPAQVRTPIKRPLQPQTHEGLPDLGQASYPANNTELKYFSFFPLYDESIRS